MKNICLGATLFLVLMSICTAYAATVTVTPVDMQGWVEATNYSNISATIKNVAPEGCPAGDGAAYGTTGQYGSLGTDYMGQSWFGTNAYTGVKLSEITKLEYWTYAFKQGVDKTHFTTQPFELYLFVTRDGINWRPLLFRPWGYPGAEEMEGSHNPWAQWIRVDPIACKCYDANGSEIVTTYTPCWIDLYCPGSGNVYTQYTWDGIKAMYPNAILTTPTTGWNSIIKSPTGCTFNIFAGAIGLAANWYIHGSRDMYNFAGYVDDLTIGVNGNETTYDFEGPVAAGTYAIGNATAKSAAMQYAKQWHRFVVYGKVTTLYTDQAKTVVDPDNFLVDDGSGVTVKVHAVSYDAFKCAQDNYIRAVGTIDNTTTPATLNSSATAVQNLYEEIHFP